jgi:hypothetical protein
MQSTGRPPRGFAPSGPPVTFDVRALMRPFIKLSAFATLMALIGCEPVSPAAESPPTLYSVSMYYADPTEHQQFKSALRDAGVPFELEVREGREYVLWEGRYQQRVEAIEAKLFGPPLPQGRHVSLDPASQEQFKRWLKQSGIPFTTQIKRGREYIVWSEEDDERVRKSPYSSNTPKSPNYSIGRTSSGGLRPP